MSNPRPTPCPECEHEWEDGACWNPHCDTGAANIEAEWADAELHARGDEQAERLFDERRRETP